MLPLKPWLRPKPRLKLTPELVLKPELTLKVGPRLSQELLLMLQQKLKLSRLPIETGPVNIENFYKIYMYITYTFRKSK